MKDCLLVGVVCLVLGFFLHDLVYPKDKVENYKMSKNDQTVIIISIIAFCVMLVIIASYWFMSPKKSSGSYKSSAPKK